jgi:hypothetical protein
MSDDLHSRTWGEALVLLLAGMAALGLWGLWDLHSRQPADPPAVELPPVYAEPVCERTGPYPYTADSLDMWVVICPKGDTP